MRTTFVADGLSSEIGVLALRVQLYHHRIFMHFSGLIGTPVVSLAAEQLLR
jgi:hypothetical protein